MKLLLVDDDEFLCDMYATKFGEAGHTVEVATSGERAVEMLSKASFDVVLLDIVMPGMSGQELLHHIKTESLGGGPTCIVLSNQGEETDIAAAKKAGAEGYIVKAEMIPSDVVAHVESLAKNA